MSGLKINVDKTEAVWIGSKAGSKDRICKHLKLNWKDDGKFRSLGIDYEILESDITWINYAKQEKKIKKLLKGKKTEIKIKLEDDQ